MYNILVCDVKVIMSQALGEFEGKIAKTEIDIVVNEPDEDIIILADGRHLWRVFENLINNVCKIIHKTKSDCYQCSRSKTFGGYLPVSWQVEL